MKFFFSLTDRELEQLTNRAGVREPGEEKTT